MTTTTITTRDFGRRFLLGLACCGLAACAPSENSPGSSSGGAGTGGAGTGGAITTGGATGSGAPVVTSTGGAATGGAATGGAATGGAVTGTGGSAGGGGGRGGGGMATTGGAGGGSVGGGSGDCNGAVLCDSFERAMLGPDWVLDNTMPTVIELVTTKAHTGMSSVHISFGTAATQSYISEMKTFPAMGMAFWGRAWIFSMVPTGGHQIYIEARVGAGSDKTGVRPVNTQGANLATNLESSDAGMNSTIKMTTGSWVCYEWQITGIGGAGTFTSYVDGMMIAKQSGTIPPLARQRIGIQRYMAGTAGEMWIDDVGIGPNRIGCM